VLSNKARRDNHGGSCLSTILLLCYGINRTFLVNKRDGDEKDKTDLSGNILPLLCPMLGCTTASALHLN